MAEPVLMYGSESWINTKTDVYKRQFMYWPLLQMCKGSKFDVTSV